jgi:hypothetical protein
MRFSAPLSLETIAKVLALPCTEPPGEGTHWTGRMVAKAVGISLSAVQRLILIMSMALYWATSCGMFAETQAVIDGLKRGL